VFRRKVAQERGMAVCTLQRVPESRLVLNVIHLFAIAEGMIA